MLGIKKTGGRRRIRRKRRSGRSQGEERQGIKRKSRAWSEGKGRGGRIGGRGRVGKRVEGKERAGERV